MSHEHISQADRERIELDFWRACTTEREGARSLVTLVSKLGEARWLLANLEAFEIDFRRARSILELGAGQGWAACIVKRLFPQAEVRASDLSADALLAVASWTAVLGAAPDETIACSSYDIPFADASFDLVYCFQSAHHFGTQRPTLIEVQRVLRPGGVCLYLHEPSCRRYLHRMAVRRVRRRRPDMAEDVLVYPELLGLGRELGFAADIRFDPTPVNRRPLETAYYALLDAMPPLQHVLPCTADYRFRKR